MEADELIIRKSKPVIPPHVTYELSNQGRALRSVLYAMAEWAVVHSGEHSETFSKQIENFPVV